MSPTCQYLEPSENWCWLVTPCMPAPHRCVFDQESTEHLHGFSCFVFTVQVTQAQNGERKAIRSIRQR